VPASEHAPGPGPEHVPRPVPVPTPVAVSALAAVAGDNPLDCCVTGAAWPRGTRDEGFRRLPRLAEEMGAAGAGEPPMAEEPWRMVPDEGSGMGAGFADGGVLDVLPPGALLAGLLPRPGMMG
jgi:hypothetical protein